VLQRKAEYICADQPVTFIFRLRQGGGPYIPGCPSSTRNARYSYKSISNQLGNQHRQRIVHRFMVG